METMIYCRSKYLEEHPLLWNLCQVLGERLREERIYLVRGVYTDYEIRFDDNTSWFKLDHFIEREEEGHLSFYIELMVNDIGVWNVSYRNETLEHFGDTMYVYRGSGFPDGGRGFMWNSTACELNCVVLEPPEPPGPYDEDWGDLSDLDKIDEGRYRFADPSEDPPAPPDPYAIVDTYVEWERLYGMAPSDEGHSGPEAGQPDTDFEEPESFPSAAQIGLDEAEDTGGRFMGAAGWRVPSIVPDGITQIRVVALKHQGVLVAFRFKTNVGAFDVRKDVAVRYGLGDFKTEKFIPLQSVNGMLMSESERKRRACVPDVSECEEDCEKLMNAMFAD